MGDIPPENITAVGDGVNDYPMFRYAGFSIGIGVKEPDKVDINLSTLTEALEYLLSGKA